MSATKYRMKVTHIIWWTAYVLLTRAFFASVILLIGVFIVIPFGLDQRLHVAPSTLLSGYVLLFSIYVLNIVSKRIVYVSVVDSKLILWSLLRRYVLTRGDIKSINEVTIKPRFVGFSQWPGIGYPFKSDERRIAIIETTSGTLAIDLSLNTFIRGLAWVQSFGEKTPEMLSALQRWVYEADNIKVS